MLDAKQIAEIVRRQDLDQEVTPSTLHYYVQVGILPPAVGRGRSGYTPDHLTRFRLARRMKRQGAALAEIRERLRDMSPAEVAIELAAGQPGAGQAAAGQAAAGQAAAEQEDEQEQARAAGTVYRLAPAPAPMLLGEAATRYSIATEALRARSGDTPRTLRFRGGFSLQVPAGTSDEQIARLYTAIEAVLDEEDEKR